MIERIPFGIQVLSKLTVSGPARPGPGSLSARAESDQRHAQGERTFRTVLSPWESPLLRATKTGASPPFWIFPGETLRWKMTIPAPVSGFGLVRFGCACVERKFLVCACRGCVLLFECYSAAQPLAALPPYGCGVPLAGAARLWRGRGSGVLGWSVHAPTSITDCSSL